MTQKERQMFFDWTKNIRMSKYRKEWPSTECPKTRFTEIMKGLTVIIFTVIKFYFTCNTWRNVAVVSISYCVTGVCNPFYICK